MLQLRGLGVIDSYRLGVRRAPQVVDGGVTETVPASTGYPTVPPNTGGSSGGARTTYGRGDMAVMVNAAQPSYPVMQPNAPSVEPPLPSPPPLPPMAANPSNPSMPAPSGTQVTYQPQPFYQQSGFKKLGWWLLGLGVLGAGIGFAVKHR